MQQRPPHLNAHQPVLAEVAARLADTVDIEILASGVWDDGMNVDASTLDSLVPNFRLLQDRVRRCSPTLYK